MEAIKDAIAYISDEWTVIAFAPVSFITAVALLGVAIWFFVRLIHKGEIAGLKATITSHNATITTQKERMDLSRDRLDDSQQRLVELEFEIEKTKEAIPVANSVAMQHSLAASTIASDIRLGLGGTSRILNLPAHLAAASGFTEPVPFEGMDDTKGAKKDNENK